MATAEEKLQALRQFRGDIIIYADGSIGMSSTVDGQPDSWGKDWDAALDRLHRKLQKLKEKVA